MGENSRIMILHNTPKMVTKRNDSAQSQVGLLRLKPNIVILQRLKAVRYLDQL